MRDAVANITLPTVRHPLEVVRNQFEAWRKRRPCRGRIPESLWQAGVALCMEHSVWEVSRALRLNYNALKDRVPKARVVGLAVGQRPDLGFVRLDLGAPIAPSEYRSELDEVVVKAQGRQAKLWPDEAWESIVENLGIKTRSPLQFIEEKFMGLPVLIRTIYGSWTDPDDFIWQTAQALLRLATIQ